MADSGLGDKIDFGRRFLGVRALAERVRQSLFYLPFLFLLVSMGLAQGSVWVDQRVAEDLLPDFFASTVDSARALLGAIAGGTITAASLVFSLTLIAVQLASSQYSPRTVGTFLGDRFQQVVIGVVTGTFVYCLLVLRVVRDLTDDGADTEPFVPRLSVTLGVVLGVASLIAVIASINRTAQTLRIESVVTRVTEQTIHAIRDRFGDDSVMEPVERSFDPLIGDTPLRAPDDREVPAGSALFGAPERGWVQQLSAEAIVDAVPEGSHVFVTASVGDYLQVGQPVAYVHPPPDEPEEVLDKLADALAIGQQRTMQQDVGFGIIQLTDIAVRALSPGVNDPNTANEVIVRLGSVLVELAVRDLAPREVLHDGCTLVRTSEPTHADYFELAFEPIHRYAREDPQVLAALVRTLGTIRDQALYRRRSAHVHSCLSRAAAIMNQLDSLPYDEDRRIVRAAAIRASYGDLVGER